MANLNPDDHEGVKRTTEEILSRPEYDALDESWLRTVTYYIQHPDELLTELLDLVASWFNGSTASQVAVWAFLILMSVFAVTLVIKLTRSTRRDRRSSLTVAPDLAGKSAKHFAELSDKCAQEGNFVDAVRFRYSHLLARLGELQLIRVRAGRTTGEYATEISQNLPAARNAFAVANSIFERAWYGHSIATINDLESFKQHELSVLKEATS